MISPTARAAERRQLDPEIAESNSRTIHRPRLQEFGRIRPSRLSSNRDTGYKQRLSCVPNRSTLLANMSGKTIAMWYPCPPVFRLHLLLAATPIGDLGMGAFPSPGHSPVSRVHDLFTKMALRTIPRTKNGSSS